MHRLWTLSNTPNSYWTQDINSLNSHFGTADDLKALSSALHSRGMYLMVDVVVNHMVGTADPPNYSAFQPFSSQSDFHAECFVQNYDNQTEVEQCWLGDKNVPLVDLNTEDNNVVSTMNNWISTLVSNYSVDGVRIDTVKHVRKDFWPDFAKSAGVFTIGEVLNNETSYVSAYTGKVVRSPSEGLRLTILQRSSIAFLTIPPGSRSLRPSRPRTATSLLWPQRSSRPRARTRMASS